MEARTPALAFAPGILLLLTLGACLAGCQTAEVGLESSAQPSDPNVMRIEAKPPFRILTLKRSEWRKLGVNSDGRYRDPEANEFTMALPMRCLSCGQVIPVPAFPADLNSLRLEDRDAAIARIQGAYKCPRCGKSVFSRQAP